MTGLHRARVAELIVTTPDGRQRGSGYRVTTDAVLTAAHVLANAESVAVRFESDLPGEWTVQAASWWAGSSSDLALVTISGEPVEPALFGQVGDRAAVIDVQAVGFPLWKFRSDYRDAFHATGTVAVLSNWRSGTLEFSLSPAPDAPWNGMSGAALWAGDRIVGVVTAHHPGDGPARLAATRIDQSVLDRLGVRVWPDVVRDAPADRVLSAYRDQLAETAPAELLDREAELDELVRFCAGDEPYRWLQAGPWAGKSALLSSFVLRYLPRGVDVVSFFITRRFAGQSDSDAFTEAMIEQLAALVDEPTATLVQSPARRGHLTRLLREAAQRSAEAGRRLLLVVDGLDEDTGHSSIAALLPAEVPVGVRVLVASRPHPGLPDDVPPDHPLRTLIPRPLAGSPHARDIAMRAKVELRAALRGSDHERTALGLITASGGGLTGAEIEEVTGWAPYEIDQVFEGRLARSLTHRASSSLYVFSHETLRELAYQQLGSTLATYRGQLHDWAARYQGWPASTPIYLMRGYPRMLAATGDLPRLLALAIDRNRQERLLEYSGGDTLAQIEIANATTLAAREQDIGALLLLAVLRDELTDRNAHTPADLPAVWIKLGEPTRALALANSIADPTTHADALVALTRVLYDDDQYRTDRRVIAKVKREVAKLADPDLLRDRTHAALAAAAAKAGWYAEAREFANEIVHSDTKLTAQVICVGATGDLDQAEQLAEGIWFDRRRAEALTALFTFAARAGDEERMRRLADAATLALPHENLHYAKPQFVELAMALGMAGLDDHDLMISEIVSMDPTFLLAALVKSAVANGHRDRARDLIARADQKIVRSDDAVDDNLMDARTWLVSTEMAEIAAAFAALGDFGRVEQIIPELVNTAVRHEATAQFAKALAEAGEHDRAERQAIAIPDAKWRARALTWVAAAHEGDNARRLAVIAGQAARQIVDPWRRGAVLGELVRPLAEAGAQGLARKLVSAAENLAGQIPDESAKADALCTLIVAAGIASDAEHVRSLAEKVRSQLPGLREGYDELIVVRSIVVSTALAGHIHLAEQLAQESEDVWWWLRSLLEAAVSVASAGNRRGAERLLSGAEHRYRVSAASAELLGLLPLLIEAAIAVGDQDKAEQFYREFTDGSPQIDAKAELAIGLFANGHHGRARDLAVAAWEEVSGQGRRAVITVAEALAVVGQHERAMELARVVDLADSLSDARRVVAVRLAAAGEHARAEQFAREIESSWSRSVALVELAELMDEESARRVVTEVLTSEAWRPAVGPAAKLIGPRVVEIAEYLLD